jgi:hypothetical protein
MKVSLELFAVAGVMALLTWFSYRTGVDQVVERDRSPLAFKVNMALRILILALVFAGGVLSLIYPSR